MRYDLNKMIINGESETLEFKNSFDREAIETVSAFANTHGGTLLIGVTDWGEVRGIDIGKETGYPLKAGYFQGFLCG